MRPSERRDRQRRQRAYFRRTPEYARAAFEVANLCKLPDDMAEWPEGLVFALGKMVECRDALHLRLGRDPVVGEVACEYLLRRHLECVVAVNAQAAGTGDHGHQARSPEMSRRVRP